MNLLVLILIIILLFLVLFMFSFNPKFKSNEIHNSLPIKNINPNISESELLNRIDDVTRTLEQALAIIVDHSYYSGCEACNIKNDNESELCTKPNIFDRLDKIKGKICDPECPYIFIDQLPKTDDDLDILSIYNGRYPELNWKHLSGFIPNWREYGNELWEQLVKNNTNKAILHYRSIEGWLKVSVVRRIRFLNRDCVIGCGFKI